MRIKIGEAECGSAYHQPMNDQLIFSRYDRTVMDTQLRWAYQESRDKRLKIRDKKLWTRNLFIYGLNSKIYLNKKY